MPDHEWVQVGTEVSGRVGRAVITGVHLRPNGLYVEVTPFNRDLMGVGWFPVDWITRNFHPIESVGMPEEVPQEGLAIVPLINIIGEPFGEVPEWFAVEALFEWNDEPYVIEEIWHPIPEMEPILRIRNLNTEQMLVEGGGVLREEAIHEGAHIELSHEQRAPILREIGLEITAEIVAEHQRIEDMLRTIGPRILSTMRNRRRPSDPEPVAAVVEEGDRGPKLSVWQRLLEKREPDAGAGGAAAPRRVPEDTTPMAGPELE